MAKYDILAEELDKIQDLFIRAFTKEALEATDDKFYSYSCSSTGVRHPPEDNKKGGIMRHVKKGVVVIEQFARRAAFSPLELDIALSAFILHDTCKNGIKWSEKTNWAHGYVGAKWLGQFGLDDNPVVKETILNAIRYHMAPWVYRHVPWEHDTFTQQQVKENWEEMQRALTCPSRIELAVREADYWSSREEMSYLPGVPIIGPHDMPPEEVAKKYLLKVENGRLGLIE